MKTSEEMNKEEYPSVFDDNYNMGYEYAIKKYYPKVIELENELEILKNMTK